MKGFFNEKGNQFVLNDAHTKLPLYNYHFNKNYYMTVANDMFGESRSLNPDSYTFNTGFRYCFIKDNDKVFSLGNRGNISSEPDNKNCVYNLHSTVLSAKYNDIEIELTAFVPLTYAGEIFDYQFKNLSADNKKIEIALIYSFVSDGMGVRTHSFNDGKIIACESLPYHAKYDDYAKSLKYKHTAFSVSNIKPKKICCSEYALFDGNIHNSANVFDCKNVEFASGEKSVAAFIYEMDIKPYSEINISTFTSLAFNFEEIKNNAEKYFELLDNTKNLLNETEQYFIRLTSEKLCRCIDDDVNKFASYWAKKQVLCMCDTRRRTKMYCVRNSLQDALGLSFINEQRALEYFKQTICLQENNGWLRQHGIWDDLYPIGGLGTMIMRDGPAWLLLCISLYINDSKNYAFLDEIIPYKNGGQDSVLNHLLKAVDFMWQDRGMFGLSLLGDGDWTDPINGPGRNGKGVSTWTSMAFVFGMREFMKIASYIGIKEQVKDLENKINEMSSNIISACYKDGQFVAGYDDNGVAYGSNDDEEGSLFLNMHSWAILSGVATGEVAKRCIEIIKSLIVPFGAVLIRPSFSKWNEKFGRISLKSQGCTENGSAYCHASLFAVYALLLSGEKEEGLKLLKNILPTHEYKADLETQVPIFIPNYYYALNGTNSYGRSSAENITGSPNWFLKIYKDFFN